MNTAEATDRFREYAASKNGNGNGHGFDAKPRLPAFLTGGQLVDAYPNLRPVQIDGFLRVGEVGTVVSGSKCRKTFLMMGLAVVTTVGGLWLGRYQTRCAKVLYLDNELHGETTAHRLPSIADAEGVPEHEWHDRLCVENFRGDLPDIYALDSYFRAIPNGEFGLIILDSLYRTWPSGLDENSNGDVTKVYNQLDRYAALTGAAILMVHHASKGAQGNKSITDVGAGAGSIARAADAHIILRPHEEDDAAVMEAETRSFPKPAAAGIRWGYPKWFYDPFLDPTKIRRPGKGGDESGEAETVWTPEMFAQRFITKTPKVKDLILLEAEAEKLSNQKAERLLNGAIALGHAFKHVHGPRDKGTYSTDAQGTLIPPKSEGETTDAKATPKMTRKPRKAKA